MLEFLRALSPVSQALLATIGTYLLTAVGTLPVLFFRSVPRRLMDAMMGFAAGVMVAASCWSLLIPAMDMAGVFPAAVGLLVGAACLYAGRELVLSGLPFRGKEENPKSEIRVRRKSDLTPRIVPEDGSSHGSRG